MVCPGITILLPTYGWALLNACSVAPTPRERAGAGELVGNVRAFRVELGADRPETGAGDAEQAAALEEERGAAEHDRADGWNSRVTHDRERYCLRSAPTPLVRASTHGRRTPDPRRTRPRGAWCLCGPGRIPPGSDHAGRRGHQHVGWPPDQWDDRPRGDLVAEPRGRRGRRRAAADRGDEPPAGGNVRRRVGRGAGDVRDGEHDRLRADRDRPGPAGAGGRDRVGAWPTRRSSPKAYGRSWPGT